MEGSATKGLGFKDRDVDIGKRRLDLDLPHPSRSATKGLGFKDRDVDIGKRRFPRSIRSALISATKDLELRNSYADIGKSRHSIVSRIYVEGYDTSLSGHDFVMSMRAHFASCGEVMLVYIPGYVRGRSIGNRFAFVYLRGEGAEERALKLHGSYMGGHKLVVEPYPFHATYLDHELAPMREADDKQRYKFFVEGYDTSLPLDYVKGKLYEHFSKCGSIRFISLTQKEHGGPLSSSAYTAVDGIDTIEKVLQLGRCDVKGLENISISFVVPPEPDGAVMVKMLPAHLWTCSSSKTPSAMAAAAATAPEDPNLPQPPCMSTLLPYPYNLRFQNSDVEFKELCYASQPASVKRYAPEDPSLPEPWKRLASSNTYSYYWNTETNVTQYERPPSSS